MSYDPFVRGAAPVGVRTIELRGKSGGDVFTTEVWYPAADRYAGRDLDDATCDAFKFAPGLPGARQHAVRDAEAMQRSRPLVMYFHGGYGHRREATEICTHLASHDYVAAALDFPGDNIADSIGRERGTTAKVAHTPIDESARKRPAQASEALDALSAALPSLKLDVSTECVGCSGISMGGYTSLAVNSLDRRFAASFAMCPMYGTRGLAPQVARLQGLLRVDDWGRAVPVLILAGAVDPIVALPDLRELHAKVREPKRLAVLRRAGHMHFLDGAQSVHETMREAYLSGEFPDPELDAIALGTAMRPFVELCSEADSLATARSLCLALMDSELKRDAAARAFLASGLAATFTNRGIELEAA
jgi:dienelactone hydrolase